MKNKHLLAFSLLPLFIGLFLIITSPVEITKTYTQFLSRSSQQIKGTLWSPKNESNLGVVLVHGVMVNKEYLDLMARTFADNGIVALTFDLGGYGESYPRAESKDAVTRDVLAAASFLQKKLPNSDKSKIGLAGHSMGGTAAILAGIIDPNIESIVCLGMNAEVAPFKPCRLLLSAGLYDQLHSPAEMRKAVVSSGLTGSWQEYDDHRDNCAHRLFLSPTANHQTEVSDYYILREVTHWLSKTTNSPANPIKINALKSYYGMTFTGLGLFLFFTLLLCTYQYKRYLSVIFIICVVICFILICFRGLEPFAGSTIIIFIVFIMLLSNYWTKERHKKLMTFFYFTLGIIIILDLVNILNAIWEYVVRPDYLLNIPLYFIQTWLNYLPQLFIALRPHFFKQYTTALIPSWILILIFIVEALSPGLFIRLLVNLTQNIIKRSQLKITYEKETSYLKVYFLLGLITLFGIILWQRAASGFISDEALLKLCGILIRRGLPAAIFIFILLRNLPEEKQK